MSSQHLKIGFFFNIRSIYTALHFCALPNIDLFSEFKNQKSKCNYSWQNVRQNVFIFFFSFYSHCATEKKSSSKCQKERFPENTPPLAGLHLTSSFRCTVKVTVYFPGRNSKTVVKVLRGEYSDNRILQWPGTPLRMVTK